MFALPVNVGAGRKTRMSRSQFGTRSPLHEIRSSSQESRVPGARARQKNPSQARTDWSVRLAAVRYRLGYTRCEMAARLGCTDRQLELLELGACAWSAIPTRLRNTLEILLRGCPADVGNASAGRCTPVAAESHASSSYVVNSPVRSEVSPASPVSGKPAGAPDIVAPVLARAYATLVASLADEPASLADEPGSSTWRTVWAETCAARAASFADPTLLELGEPALRLLAARAPNGLYAHQLVALASHVTDDDVCVATQAASGRTLAFQAAAIERLGRVPRTRVLVVSPSRAVAVAQEACWTQAVACAGLSTRVGRVDYELPDSLRPPVLAECGVVVVTPDVLDLWLLASVSFAPVQEFLRDLALVVVDDLDGCTRESPNDRPFLYRRLEHAAHRCGGDFRFAVASAPVANLHEHLEDLFGRPMHVVEQDLDTSPRHEVEVSYLAPARPSNLSDPVSSLLATLVRDCPEPFICYLDGRRTEGAFAPMPGGDAHTAVSSDVGHEPNALALPGVLPFRAGCEDRDRERIAARLADGSLRGVISTSEVELAIDLHGLGTVVLAGVPRTATSLLQRTGHLGRTGPGRVLLLRGDDAHDRTVFAAPQCLFSLPLRDAAPCE